MEKTQNNYNFITRNGKAILTMKTKGADGRIHSATCDFPLYTEIENEETHKIEIKKQTKKQVEKYLLGVLGF